MKDQKRITGAGNDQHYDYGSGKLPRDSVQQPEAEQNDGRYAGKEILHRKVNVVGNGKRNQNPEHQEEVDMIAALRRFEKQVGQHPEPNNYEEQNQRKIPSQEAGYDRHRRKDENETQSSGIQAVGQPAGR